MNDVLYVLGDHIERFVLIIYNRWGQEVFRTVELDRGWNGQFRGEALPPDVYGYYLEVECIGGAHFSEKGNVSLIR
jgi:gliding motility-associated-like protein